MTSAPIQSPSAAPEPSKQGDVQRAKGGDRRQARRQRPVDDGPERPRERQAQRERTNETERSRPDGATQATESDAQPEKNDDSLWRAALKAVTAQRKLDAGEKPTAEAGDVASDREETATALLKLLGKPGAATPEATAAIAVLPAERPAAGLQPTPTRGLASVATAIAKPAAADEKLVAKELELPRDPTPAPSAHAPTTHADAQPAPTPKLEAVREIATRPAPLPPAPLAETRASELVQQVRMHLDPTHREATIQLDPPELGRIAIRLVVRKGRVDAELRVEDRATLDVLARHVPELRATLARNGMHSGSFDLQLGFGESQKHGADRNGQRAADPPPTELPRELKTMLATHLDRDAAVDTYA